MTEKAQDMDTADLRSRVVSLEHQGAQREQRIATLEAWRTQRDIDSARHDERWKHMDEKIDAVGKKVDEISGSLTWITRLIIGGIAAAIIAFVVRGGLHMP